MALLEAPLTGMKRPDPALVARAREVTGAPSDGAVIELALRQLIDAANQEQLAQRAARSENLRRRAGRLSGVYGPDYLDEIRHGWPQ